MKHRQLADALGEALGRLFSPRRAQRRAMSAAEIPQSWQDVLSLRSNHYRRLPAAHRREFHQQLQVFLAEKRITGVEMPLTDELRVLIGASAVTLTAGWPGYAWDRLAEVLVYPDNFDRDYRVGRHDLAGQAHPWGVVILSAPALWWSFTDADADFHLGYHEFAHLLDRSQTGGVPAYLSDEAIRKWMAIMQNEDERLRHGTSALNPYAMTAPNELFAVAVETFFQSPVPLMHSHAELYSFLSKYFQQEPAAWSISGTSA